MQNDEERNQNNNSNKTYFYIAAVCAALGVISFGLAFTVLAIYALICSVLFEICALSFCRVQKKKSDFKALRILTAVSYVLLTAVAVFFIGGIIYASL